MAKLLHFIPPNARKEVVEIPLPPSIEARALEIRRAGFRLEMETFRLHPDQISFTISTTEEDVASACTIEPTHSRSPTEALTALLENFDLSSELEWVDPETLFSQEELP